jgi:hypothetical protein
MSTLFTSSSTHHCTLSLPAPSPPFKVLLSSGGVHIKGHDHDHAHSAPAVSTGYGQPSTGYGQTNTGYGQPATDYGQPASDYGLPALPPLPKLPFELPSLEPAPTNYGAAGDTSHIVLEPMSSSYVAPPPASGTTSRAMQYISSP